MQSACNQGNSGAHDDTPLMSHHGGVDWGTEMLFEGRQFSGSAKRPPGSCGCSSCGGDPGRPRTTFDGADPIRLMAEVPLPDMEQLRQETARLLAGFLPSLDALSHRPSPRAHKSGDVNLPDLTDHDTIRQIAAQLVGKAREVGIHAPRGQAPSAAPDHGHNSMQYAASRSVAAASSHRAGLGGIFPNAGPTLKGAASLVGMNLESKGHVGVSSPLEDALHAVPRATPTPSTVSYSKAAGSSLVPDWSVVDCSACTLDCRDDVEQDSSTCATWVSTWSPSSISSSDFVANAKAAASKSMSYVEIYGATDVEKELFKAMWWVLQENIDIVMWTDCMYTGTTAAPKDMCRARLVGHIMGDYTTHMIWLNTEVGWISQFGGQHAPGTVVLPYSDTLLMWRPVWENRVSMWNSGDPDTMMCVLVDGAAALLHELTHVARYVLLDILPSPETKCYASHVMENMFRWAIFQRFPPTSCCIGFDNDCLLGCGDDFTRFSSTCQQTSATGTSSVKDNIVLGIALAVGSALVLEGILTGLVVFGAVVVGAAVGLAIGLLAGAIGALLVYLTLEEVLDAISDAAEAIGNAVEKVWDWLTDLGDDWSSGGGGGGGGCNPECKICPVLCSNGCTLNGIASEDVMLYCLEAFQHSMYDKYGNPMFGDESTAELTFATPEP